MKTTIDQKYVENRIATAYHESGHAVGCLIFGLPFRSLELDVGGGASGWITGLASIKKPEGALERQIVEQIAMMTAMGLAAEAKVTGFRNHYGAFSDSIDIDNLIFSLVGRPVHLEPWLGQLERLADEMFTDGDGKPTRAWRAVMKIANELLKEGKLSESECMDLVFTGPLPLETAGPNFRVFPWVKLEIETK